MGQTAGAARIPRVLDVPNPAWRAHKGATRFTDRWRRVRVVRTDLRRRHPYPGSAAKGLLRKTQQGGPPPQLHHLGDHLPQSGPDNCRQGDGDHDYGDPGRRPGHAGARNPPLQRRPTQGTGKHVAGRGAVRRRTAPFRRCRDRRGTAADRARAADHRRHGSVERRDWSGVQGRALGLSRPDQGAAYRDGESDHRISRQVLAAARRFPARERPRYAGAVRQWRHAFCLDCAAGNQLDGRRGLFEAPLRAGGGA